jgi:hypothetical protein
MKVIIAGSRDFNDYELLKNTCDKILSNQTDVEIVSGGARGADALGERYAKEKGYNLKIFLANWDEFGKQAGFVRNKEMGRYSDSLIAFWNGVSRGTKHMIDIAKSEGLNIRVIKY